MLIEIKKIVTEVKKVDGKAVIEPVSNRPVHITSVKNELIKVSEIRSARPWNKSTEDECEVEGGITLIYITGNPDKKPIEIRINEHFDDFKKRVHCVVIPE